MKKEDNENRKRGPRASTLLLILVLVVGLSLLLYPTFADIWNSYHQTRVITHYAEEVEEMEAEDFSLHWEQARAYNQKLLERGDSFSLSEEMQQEYEGLLDLSGNGSMGYIEIPGIDVKLPLYHGTDDYVLQVGIGHLEWSSLPVGGESSHCVVSGHRGLPSARLFTDLDKVELGDSFMLHVLDEVLTYEVDQILVVEPSETESLAITPGRDECTLITCTPYGINTHRLLVRGHRVETPVEEAVMIEPEAQAFGGWLAALCFGTPLLAIWLLLFLRRRKKKQEETN